MSRSVLGIATLAVAIAAVPVLRPDAPPPTWNVCGHTLDAGLACGTTTEAPDLRPELFAPSEAGLTVQPDGSASADGMRFPAGTFAYPCPPGSVPCAAQASTGTALGVLGAP